MRTSIAATAEAMVACGELRTFAEAVPRLLARLEVEAEYLADDKVVTLRGGAVSMAGGASTGGGTGIIAGPNSPIRPLHVDHE